MSKLRMVTIEQQCWAAARWWEPDLRRGLRNLSITSRWILSAIKNVKSCNTFHISLFLEQWDTSLTGQEKAEEDCSSPFRIRRVSACCSQQTLSVAFVKVWSWICLPFRGHPHEEPTHSFTCVKWYFRTNVVWFCFNFFYLSGGTTQYVKKCYSIYFDNLIVVTFCTFCFYDYNLRQF